MVTVSSGIVIVSTSAITTTEVQSCLLWCGTALTVSACKPVSTVSAFMIAG
jgi:hypothetical protein